MPTTLSSNILSFAHCPTAQSMALTSALPRNRRVSLDSALFLMLKPSHSPIPGSSLSLCFISLLHLTSDQFSLPSFLTWVAKVSYLAFYIKYCGLFLVIPTN